MRRDPLNADAAGRKGQTIGGMSNTTSDKRLSNKSVELNEGELKMTLLSRVISLSLLESNG